MEKKLLFPELSSAQQLKNLRVYDTLSVVIKESLPNA